MQETKKTILEVKDSDLGRFHLAVLYIVFFRFFLAPMSTALELGIALPRDML